MDGTNLEKENNNLQFTECYLPLDAPRSPQAALQYLSRTWSPSSSIYYDQLLSANQDKNVQHEDQDCKLQNCRDVMQKADQLWMVVPNGKAQNSVCYKHRKLHSGWKGILSTEILSNLSRGLQRKKKEEMRIHAAQVNATLSVAKLAAAIAGVTANSQMEPLKSRDLCIAHLGEDMGDKMGMVVASATALVAAVCAEAAESIGASKSQVALAMDMGAEIQDPAELVTLTANAATCLRGFSALKLRGLATNFAMEGSKILERGALLPVRVPIDVILEKFEEGAEGSSPTKENGIFIITLSTSGGTIQLLFDDGEQYAIWKSAIVNLMSKFSKNRNIM